MLDINQDFSAETGITEFIECNSEEKLESQRRLSHGLVAQEGLCQVREGVRATPRPLALPGWKVCKFKCFLPSPSILP